MKLASVAIILGLAVALSSPVHAARFQVCHKVLQHHEWVEQCGP
ncbi:hypothetical protein WJ542_21165 [Paraburkholderia sp. B3]